MYIFFMMFLLSSSIAFSCDSKKNSFLQSINTQKAIEYGIPSGIATAMVLQQVRRGTTNLRTAALPLAALVLVYAKSITKK